MSELDEEVIEEIIKEICTKMYKLYINEISIVLNSKLIEKEAERFMFAQIIISNLFLGTFSTNCQTAKVNPKEIFNLLEINEKIDEMEKKFLEKKDD